MACYVSVSVAGNISFQGRTVRDNVLSSFAQDSQYPSLQWMARVAQVAMLLSSTLTFPIVMTGTRTALSTLVAPVCAHLTQRNVEAVQASLLTSRKVRIVLTLTLTAIATAFSAAIGSVAVIAAVRGAVFGALTVFLLPCLLFLRLCHEYPRYTRLTVLAVGVMGTLFSAAATVSLFVGSH
ncbi:MAG: hypothetical protein MHM6MM_004063 [Cercozoa sp. M6MM]